jgi:pilus assembly protein CpaC
MKTILILLFALPSNATDLVVRLGDTVKTKTSSASSKILVANGKNIQVTASGNLLSVRGKTTGVSRITAGEEAYDVSVLTGDEYREYKNLKDLITDFQGLTLEVKRPDFVISGELLRSSDWEEIIALDIKKMNLKFQAKIHSQARADAKKMITGYLEKHHTSVGDINLEGAPTIAYKNLTPDKQKLLRATGIEIQANPEAITTAPMVRTNIVVASIHRDKIQKVGIKWPESYSAQLIPDEPITVRALESKGWGKVLASPTLLCRSGKEAGFFAGGEIPIRVIGYRHHSVTWKSYGVHLKLKPLADYQGKMSISIETEVSNIDDSKKVDDIPAIVSNKTSSHFDLTHSRTIALSGLIMEERGRSREGLPLLSSLPVLGTFFSSSDFREHKSELVIFVTPEIVLPDFDDEP